MTGTGRRRGEPAAEGDYQAERDDQTDQFSFVDDAEAEDVIDWLAFTETRTERREERRRRSRNRLIAAAVALALLVLTGGGYLLSRWLGGNGDEAAGERSTVLFQVRGPKGDAVATAVLRHDADGRHGSVLVVPPTLALQAAGEEETALKKALGEFGPSQTRDSIGDLIGVQLDGSWILEEVAFTSLVNQLGGVNARVDVDVPRHGTAPAVQSGTRHLDGDSALAYMTYRARGEPEKARAARLARVLQGLLAVLPTSTLDASRMLDNLGVIPDPEFPNERLGSALSALAADARAHRIEATGLPVRGDGLIDARGAAPVVRRLLGGSVHRTQDNGPARVLVVDGTGGGRSADVTAGQAVAVKLLGAGYRYLNGGKADEHAQNTKIQVSDDYREGRQGGEQVALTLGVPTSAVSMVRADEVAADIVVVVGDDFRP